MQVYIDESGDLGFGNKASKYFIMTALIVRNHKQIKRCITKIRKQKLPEKIYEINFRVQGKLYFPYNKKYKKIDELKWHNSSKTIKRRTIECVSNTENDVTYAVLRKEQVKKELRDKPQIIYNYLCGSLLSKIIASYKIKGTVDVIVDKSLHGLRRENFDQYITWRTLMANHEGNLRINPPNIIHKDSKQDPCIQAVDFIAGAIHHRYRENDNFYYKLIEPKIPIILDFFERKNKDYVVNPSLLRPTCLRADSFFSGRTYSPCNSIPQLLFKSCGYRYADLLFRRW